VTQDDAANEWDRDMEPGSVRAVDRALAVLFSFTRGAPMKTVAELQEDLGIKRPTLYRLLQTLERRGLVRSSGEPLRYSLDHAVMQLADTWLAQVDVARFAEEPIAELWARTDESIALHLPIQLVSRIAIKELRSKQPLSLGLGIGHVAPMTDGASGLAMLAFLGPERIETALRGVADARTRESIRADLEHVFEKGFSLTVSQRIAGAVAIASPIFDHDGEVAASLCLVGPEARLTEDIRERYISLVVNAAARISKELGYRGHPRYPMEAIKSLHRAS